MDGERESRFSSEDDEAHSGSGAQSGEADLRSPVDEDADGEARESWLSYAPLRSGHWLIDADGYPWLIVEVEGDLTVIEGRSTREAVTLGPDGRIADDNGRGFGDPVEELLPETLADFCPPPDSQA